MIKNLIYIEIMKALSKKRTYIGFILLAVIIPLIVLAINNGGVYLEQKIYGQLDDSFIIFGSLTNGYLATYLIAAVLTGQMPFLTTIIPAEIVSGEYAKGNFRMYLTRPISRGNVILSKLIVVLLYTTIIMFVFIFYTLFCGVLFMGCGDHAMSHNGLIFLGYDDIIWRFFMAFLISLNVMISISCLCFMLSAFTRNSVTPIIVTISTVFIGSALSFIPLELFEIINPYLFTGYIDLFLSSFHDPIPWNEILNATIVCYVWSGLFVFVAFHHFLKKEIAR